MAPNPNSVRISGPMWQWIERCCSLTSTPTSQEQAGVWVRQPGSHADATWLLANRPGDYSLQGDKQRVFTSRQGQYGRAWDWGFPSAWSGDWSQIGLFSDRVRVAWETDDPRAYPLFEVLCQTPEDREPEGFVFYPKKRFRVPDRSHETHMHIGVLTVYVDDPVAMADLFSLLSGEPLTAWRARRAPAPTIPSGRKESIMYYFCSNADGVGADRWAVVQGGFWFEYATQRAGDNVAAALGGRDGEKRSAQPTDKAGWDELKAPFVTLGRVAVSAGK